MLSLNQVGAFVPETTVSVHELRDELGLTDSQARLYTRFLGLDRIAVAPSSSLADMLVAAGEAALHGVDRSTVRHFVYTHTIQHVAPPSEHVLDGVRAALGLTASTAFSMSHQNCVAGLYAVQVAKYLLHGEPPEAQVLIMSGEKVFSPQVALIPGTTVMGEAASACLVGRDPDGDRVLGVAMRTLGQFYQCKDISPALQLEYKQLYVETLGGVIADALRRSGQDVGDVAIVLPHNVNRLSWRQVADHVGLPIGRVFLDNVGRLGHCFGADPFINLADARAAGRVREGDLVLLATAGLGATFAAIVVRAGSRSRHDAATGPGKGSPR